MWILTKMCSLISHIVKKACSLVEFFLFLRLALKFLNANPKTLVVSLIYKYSDILVSPFESIFPNIYWPKGHLIEIATISAMIGYAIVVFIFFQVLKLFFRTDTP